MRFIRIAKNNREISDVAFRLQVITTVDQIEDMYWDLVYAFENVRVQEEALTYAQKALDDSKRQAQVGTIPPIQVVSSQEHGGHRSAKFDSGAEQPATTATADEECSQPQHRKTQSWPRPM